MRFDRQWRRTGGWGFPGRGDRTVRARQLLGRLVGATTGGSIARATTVMRLYELALPRSRAAAPRLMRTIDVPITGQGFAWDRSEPGVLYGIDRPRQQVVVAKVPVPSQLTRAAAESAAHR